MKDATTTPRPVTRPLGELAIGTVYRFPGSPNIWLRCKNCGVAGACCIAGPRLGDTAAASSRLDNVVEILEDAAITGRWG